MWKIGEVTELRPKERLPSSDEQDGVFSQVCAVLAPKAL
jgi:hypothetical protein